MFTSAGPSRHRQPQNLHTYGLSPFHENEELTPFPIIPNYNRWERRDWLDQEHVKHIHSRLSALSTQPATNYSDAVRYFLHFYCLFSNVKHAQTRFSSIYNQLSINNIELVRSLAFFQSCCWHVSASEKIPGGVQQALHFMSPASFALYVASYKLKTKTWSKNLMSLKLNMNHRSCHLHAHHLKIALR